jgi:hypothetical protein
MVDRRELADRFADTYRLQFAWREPLGLRAGLSQLNNRVEDNRETVGTCWRGTIAAMWMDRCKTLLPR